MATPLNWYPLPPKHTRCGLHDSNSFADNPPDPAQHGRDLARYGITAYKLLAEATGEYGASKAARAKHYLNAGVMPIIRLYKSRPHPDFVPAPEMTSVYTKALGIPPYMEIGNEWNLSVERRRSVTPATIAQQWLAAADAVKQGGGIPLVYALSPGGDLYGGDHREPYRLFLDEVLRVGGKGALDRCAVALHPRPHTFPPDTTPSSSATVTFREYEWYAGELERRFGWVPPLIFTEHGYSLGDGTDTGFPRIDESRWVSFNEYVFRRADPNSKDPLPAYVFFMCYWKEIGGGWYNDNAFNGWLPAGATAWGQRILEMGIDWHYPVVNNMSLEDRLLKRAKELQLISPNPNAALEKAAYTDNDIAAAIGNEFALTHNGTTFVAQLFYFRWVDDAGQRRVAERVLYAAKGDWNNVRTITAYEKAV